MYPPGSHVTIHIHLIRGIYGIRYSLPPLYVLLLLVSREYYPVHGICMYYRNENEKQYERIVEDAGCSNMLNIELMYEIRRSFRFLISKYGIHVIGIV